MSSERLMIHMSKQRSAAVKIAILLLTAVLSLTACGTSEDDSSQSSDRGAFPVTVETPYGEITIKDKPQKIVDISGAFADPLDAIGERPVISGNGGEAEKVYLENQPWMKGLYSEYDARLTTAEYKPSMEAIAAQKPDLITLNSLVIDEQVYEELSKIAPVYANDISPILLDENLTNLGKITGKTEEAKKAISLLDDEFAEARTHLTGLQGKTFNAAFYVPAQNALRMVDSYDWVKELGLVVADNQPTTGEEPFALSLENFDEFKGDVASILTDKEGRAALEADPRFAELPAVKNGLLIWDDPVVANALSAWSGPTSLKWLLERILPQLEKSQLNQSAH